MIAICVGQEELGKVFAVIELAEGVALGAVQADTTLFKVIIINLEYYTSINFQKMIFLERKFSNPNLQNKSFWTQADVETKYNF